MQKNVASQKAIFFAYDSTTNLPKVSDAANLTAYVSKDYGAVTVLADTSATEMDATNAKGYYLFDLAQAETNADTLLFTAKSVTANIVVIGSPATVFTMPIITGDAFARLGAPVGASISADIAAVQADLPQRITKNVALASFVFFMEDSSSVGTGKTGLTITATRSLDGAAFAACANAASEIANGFYKISFDATDLNANVVALSFAGTGAVTRRITLITQPT